MRDITKRCVAQIGGFGKAPFGFVPNYSQIRNQQWRAFHSHSLRRLSKASASKPPSNASVLCRAFSSSERSKIGFVGWYLNRLDSHPLFTKSISSSLIYAAADYTSQTITSPNSGSFDPIRTLRMAAYGLLILGPSQHFWFNFVSKVFPKRDLISTLNKILMGQAIYGPCITSIFFSYNAGLQGESGGEIVARLKRDLLPTLINGAMFWPVCDFVTFKFVPVHLQPLMNSSCAYLWTIYLTYMASLKKVDGAD